jgi:hypothetical protein
MNNKPTKKKTIHVINGMLGMPPNLDHLGPAAPVGAGADGSRVMKCEKPTSGIKKLAMEILVEGLNHWKAEIDEMTKPKETIDPSDPNKTIITQPVFNEEKYNKLFMRCMEAVRLLLLLYGPAPPKADDAFIRFLLLVESYQERHDHRNEKSEDKTEDKTMNDVKSKEKERDTLQKTLDQIFS